METRLHISADGNSAETWNMHTFFLLQVSGLIRPAETRWKLKLWGFRWFSAIRKHLISPCVNRRSDTNSCSANKYSLTFDTDLYWLKWQTHFTNRMKYLRPICMNFTMARLSARHCKRPYRSPTDILSTTKNLCLYSYPTPLEPFDVVASSRL